MTDLFTKIHDHVTDHATLYSIAGGVALVALVLIMLYLTSYDNVVDDKSLQAEKPVAAGQDKTRSEGEDQVDADVKSSKVPKEKRKIDKDRLKRLSKKIGAPPQVIDRIGKIILSKNVPKHQWMEIFQEALEDYREVQEDLLKTGTDDFHTKTLLERAIKANRKAAFPEAEDLILEAEERERAASLESTTKPQAHARNAVRLRAIRAQLAMCQLEYVRAAGLFESGADLAQGVDERMRIFMLVAAGFNWRQHGKTHSDKTSLLKSLGALRAALGLVSKESDPLFWADIQNDYAGALENLGRLEPGAGYREQAVAAYRAAIRECTQSRAPMDWAMTQYNLGVALESLAEFQPGTENLKQAVSAYRAALGVYTRGKEPAAWAMVQNALGNALGKLGERENGTARLEEAISAYRAALSEYSRERAALDWAMVQNNLGNALKELGIRQNSCYRLEEAEKAYRAALEEYSPRTVPRFWGAATNNLGVVLRSLAEREAGTSRLQEAVKLHREALKVFTREGHPRAWASTQNHLAEALQMLGQRQSNPEVLREALAAYEASLQIYDREQTPRDWERVRMNLGTTHSMLGEIQPGSGHLVKSIEIFRAILKETDREKKSLEWAAAQNNLGTALLGLGEHRSDLKHLDEARVALEAALVVYRYAGAEHHTKLVSRNLSRCRGIMKELD